MSTPPEQPGTTRLDVALAGAAAVAVCLHAWFGYKGFADDQAFVSFRVAERLGDGLGMTWNDGSAIERHHDPAWVWLLAAAGSFGIEPIRAARLVGYLGAGLATIAVSLDARIGRPRWQLAATGGLALAATGALAAAAMSGSGMALIAGCVALALPLAARVALEERPRTVERILLALLLTATALLRADGYALVLGLLGGGAFASRKLRRWVAVALPPILALGALTAWRIQATGTWLPPTIPDHLDTVSAARGLWWLVGALGAHAALVGAAAVGLYQLREAPESWVAGGVLATWSVHLVILGGSDRPAWALLVPLLPALALLAGHGLAPLLRSAAGTGLLVALGFGHFALTNATGGLPQARLDHSEWYAPPMAHILRSAFGDRAPTLAVEEPGVLPFWTGFPTVLVEEEEALWADRPDVLVFGDDLGSLRPTTRAGRRLRQRPDFDEYYQAVAFTARSKVAGRIRATFFLLREGGQIGIDRGPERIAIPGWFAASPGSWAARWNGDTLAAPLTDARTSAVPRLLLRAGRWELRSPDGDIGVDFRCEGRSATRLDVDAHPVLELDEPGHVDLVLWARDAGVPLTELVLRRTDREPTQRCEGVPTTPIGLLPDEAQPGSDWDAPGAMVFGEEGLRVQLDEPVSGGSLELAADGNDAYAIRWFAEALPAGRSAVEPAPAGGLQWRTLPIPARAVELGADRFVLVPVAGDGTYSVGALRLAP